ncbi:hypothetical protein LTR37_014731 [Vermiconidia calcicola]|uniref:Uncharacterized protein n=1 Tax=Vermiconidia calcicola TaxID=1690605 RepID=A0ACC3MU89_9PEZI|nr:hypothetical protein LTR37_014731 [Vermiconidia calcicola]
MALKTITVCLWFDGNGEEAAQYYTSIFPNSRIINTTRYIEAGREFHGQESGKVMTVAFELDSHPFLALNGGPQFQFSLATSFVVDCKDQAEVDYYWTKLGDGGDASKSQCGWLQDKFGVAWQVVPSALIEMLTSADEKKVANVTNAMMRMKKFDIAELKAAFESGNE